MEYTANRTLIAQVYASSFLNHIANIYEIHPQPEDPDICCFTKLSTWIRWMEHSGRKLQPDDFVFPALDVKGCVKVKEPLSHTRVQVLLDLFTRTSGASTFTLSYVQRVLILIE